jgi:phosphate butyryltransferase
MAVEARGVSLPSFTQLFWHADARGVPVPVAVAGAHDPSVLKALAVAVEHEWIRPIVVGPEAAIRATAEANEVSLDGFSIVAAEGDAIAPAAVAEVRQGRARMLMKGRIATPELLRAVLDPDGGLRTGRLVCQVVLMDVHTDGRRFLMADTGIRVAPGLAQKIGIIESTVTMAHALGVERPRVALLAATETVNPAMPETVEAAALRRRNRAGEFPDCVIEGPLSFDLAYAASAAEAKQIEGAVVGAADVMVFPNLVSANLTVKAIMYTAPCRFGGVLRGTTAPVVFMSRADSPATRLNSLVLALRLLEPRG